MSLIGHAHNPALTGWFCRPFATMEVRLDAEAQATLVDLR